MIFYYLDASAWVKRYYFERGTDRLQMLLSQKAKLACSTLGLIEVSAALIRKAKSLKTPRQSIEAKLAALDHDWEDFFEIRLSAGVAKAAIRAIKQYCLRASDAVHLASALQLEKRLAITKNRLIFVTSDHELIAAARAANLIAIDPEEESK